MISYDQDQAMNIPQRHIPGRFVTKIPPDFASSAKKLSKKNSCAKKPSKEKTNQPESKSLNVQQTNWQSSIAFEQSIEEYQIDDVLDLNNEFEW